jgi:hypothetical protein
MYGVKARLPIDLKETSEKAITWTSVEDDERQGDRLRQFADQITGLREEASINIGKAQQKQKKRFDIKHAGQLYKVGIFITIVQPFCCNLLFCS